MRKTTDNPIPLLLMASLILAGPSALRAADATVEYRAQSANTTVEIQGTSTFHDWEMKGTTIGGLLDFPAGTVFDLTQTNLPGLKDGNLPATGKAMIPVRAMHSQVAVMPGVMDGVMQGAMGETNFPRILYQVTELKLKTPHVAGQPFAFDATGNLTIAGVTNKVAFPVTIEPLDKDKIVVRGTASLKMTDYKVPPPAPNIIGLGIMKCGDDIKVLFNWTCRCKPRQSSRKAADQGTPKGESHWSYRSYRSYRSHRIAAGPQRSHSAKPPISANPAPKLPSTRALWCLRISPRTACVARNRKPPPAWASAIEIQNGETAGKKINPTAPPSNVVASTAITRQMMAFRLSPAPSSNAPSANPSGILCTHTARIIVKPVAWLVVGGAADFSPPAAIARPSTVQ